MTELASIEARIERRRRALAASIVVAAATTVVTGCAHALGGGTAPDALLLLSALVTTMLVLAPVLGSRASIARRVTAVAIAQLLQHGLYSLPDTAAVASHHHDASAALGSFAVAHAHAAMPLAHLGAGLVTLWLLRAGPRAVAAVQGAMSLRLAAATLDWTPPPARRRASVSASRRAPRAALDVLRDALARRGPPLLVG